MPGTAKAEGVDPFNVDDNIKGGISYFKKQLDRFGSPELALAAYNAGPEAVKKHGGVPPYSETRAYVRKTMSRWKKSLDGGQTAPSIPGGWESYDEPALNVSTVPEGWEEFTPLEGSASGAVAADTTSRIGVDPPPEQVQPGILDRIGKYVGEGVGEPYLSPEDQAKMREGLAKNTEQPAESVGQFITEKVPASALKLATDTLSMPGDIAVTAVKPWLQSPEEKAAYIESVKNAPGHFLPRNSFDEWVMNTPGISNVYQSADELMTGLATFIGEPLGAGGWDAFKNRWLGDPVGSVAAVAPVAAPFLKSKGVKNPTEADVSGLVKDAIEKPEHPIAQEFMKGIDEGLREAAGTGRESQIEVAPGEFKTQGEVDLGMVENMRREMELEKAVAPVETPPLPGPEWEMVKPEEVATITADSQTIKEPWELTRDEFANEVLYRGINDRNKGSNKHWADNIGLAEYHAGKSGRMRIGYKSDVHPELLSVEGDYAPIEQVFRHYQFTGLEINPKLPKEYQLPIRGEVPVGTDPHKFLVQQAISEGKPVPESVLKDYPDLAEQIFERNAIQEEGQSEYLWDRPTYEAEVSNAPLSKDLERTTTAPVPSTEFAKVPEGAKRSEMIKEMEKALDIPIRYGRFNDRALGIAKMEPGVIRLKSPNDVEVATHELAHFAQPLMGIAESLPKEVMDMAYEGAKNKSQEGFAEFVRYYVTQPEVAIKRAPTFYKFFEGKLAMYPDVGNIFIKTREAWQQYQAAPSVAKVMSFIQQEAPKAPRMSLDDVYTKMVDELRPVQILKDIAEKKAGRELRPSEDPYLLAWATRGWARKAEQYLKWGQFQLSEVGMEKVGPSFREIMKPVEKAGERELLDTYLVAKRAVSDERITKGFGNILPRADFVQTVKELEPRFKDVANQLYKYSDNLLRYLVDSGRMSEDAYQAIKQKNLFYAPFYRVMDTDPSVSGMSKRKFADLPEGVKRLKGSSRDIYSPTQNIMQNTYALMNLAERARIGEALIKVSRIEGMGPFIEKLPVKIKAVSMTTEEAMSSAAKQMGVSLSKMKGLMEEAGFAVDDLPEVLRTFRPNYQTKPNEVILYNRGNPEVYQLAPDLYKSMMGLDADSIGALTKLVALPAKLLRTGATLSPEFIIRNPVRDQWTAGIYSRYGYLPFYDMAKGIGHILGKTDLYEEFNTSGAAHAALVSLDRNYLSQNIKDLLAGRAGQIKNVVKNPLQMLQALSELTEEATRVGEFVRGLKAESKTSGYTGMDALLKAGTAARDVTLDFSRVGTATKGMNAITAFWNASVQGVDKMIREFRSNPVPVLAKTAAGITLPSIALYWAQKDDKFYQEIPTWRRALFWNVVTHNEDGSLKNIWSIPKPFELGILFGTFPEMMLDYMYTKNRSGMDQAMTSFLQAMTPSVMPTALVPIVEWTTNRSWFFDRPTVPRDKEGLKPFLQYTPFTTETIKLLARGMSKIPILKNYGSPSKLENLVRGTTGNLGYSSLKVSDAVLKGLNLVDAPTSPAMTLADLPGIKGFIQRMPTANSRSIEEFYKEYTDLKVEYESAKQQAGVRGLGKFGIKGQTPEALQKYESTAKALSVYRSLADMIYENKTMPSETKRQNLDALYMQMIDTARASLKKKP
jgi:hypothetical protein